MDYKERLKAFNDTDKYKSEVRFLDSLIGNSHKEILDYGCGLGYTAEFIGANGYDVNDYAEALISYYTPITIDGVTYPNLPAHDLDDIYFMHSLAHIPNALDILIKLKKEYNARITVITPNRLWLDEGYQSDETVIKHYDQRELHDLFTAAGYEVSLIGQFGELKKGFNERIFLQAK